MKYVIRFGDSAIAYSVTKSRRRKTSAIIVDGNGVEVKAPATKNDSEIRLMVAGKADWIFKKQLEFAGRDTMPPKARPKSARYLEDRVWGLASTMGLKPSKVVVKSLRSRWGSCTKHGTITINSALSRAPLRVIDYVVVHELCHLKIRDHSRRFWELVGRYCRDYEEQIKWLESGPGPALQKCQAADR